MKKRRFSPDLIFLTNLFMTKRKLILWVPRKIKSVKNENKYIYIYMNISYDN